MEAPSHGGDDGISGTAPGMWTVADCGSTDAGIDRATTVVESDDRMLMTNTGTDRQCMNHHEKMKTKNQKQKQKQKQKMMMIKKKKKKINSRETPSPSPSPSTSPSSPPPVAAAAAASAAPNKGLMNNLFKAAAGTFARFFKGNK